MLGGDRRHLKICTFLRMEKEMQPTPVGLPGKSHGQRSLADYSPRGHKESGTIKRAGTAYAKFKILLIDKYLDKSVWTFGLYE